MVKQQIWLPTTGQRKSFKVGRLRFFAEDGQVIWEDEDTGRSGSMLPEKALRVVKQLAKDLLGNSVETSIGKDSQDRAEIAELMRRLEQLAKDELPRQPDLGAARSMLWLPGA